MEVPQEEPEVCQEVCQDREECQISANSRDKDQVPDLDLEVQLSMKLIEEPKYIKSSGKDIFFFLRRFLFKSLFLRSL
jgi:hypothetical protein